MSALAATPSNGHVTHGLPMSRIDTASSGFTPVNGDTHMSAQPKPGETTVVPISAWESGPANRTDTERAPSETQYYSHGWRPDTRSSRPPQNERTDARKRKRSVSTGVDSPMDHGTSQPQDDSAKSPKRRVTCIDSAVDLTSSDTAAQPPPAFPQDRRVPDPRQVGASSREPSPVRKPKGAFPVPPPRPEIEAGLAESLQRELYNAQQAQAQAEAEARARAEAQAHAQALEAAQAQAHAQAQAYEQVQAQAQVQVQARAEATTPPADMHDQHESMSYSPDQIGDYDARKRKRNFSNRTKTGCHTCRTRKKKCDEGRPICANCERGGFGCGGYGPKPTGKNSNAVTRQPVTLQSKPAYEPAHGPSTYFSPQVEEGRSYSHWGRIVEPEPPRPPIIGATQSVHPTESWPRPVVWPPSEPPPAYMPERLPPPEFPTMPSLRAYASGHPLPPPLEPWPADHSALTPYRPATGQGAAMSSRHSESTSSSQRAATLALSYSGTTQVTEKNKMLLGRPFRAYQDDVLLNDRAQCRAALERYNDSARAASGISSEERARFFRAVVEPPYRPGYRERYPNPHEPYIGPKGYVGHSTLIETPFTCDYGYNIHLAEQILIQPGCYMQDACEIHIGARTIVGPNVKFYGTTASVNASKRKGSQGDFIAGAIKIGEDCFIGGDVVILPFRRIGSGAVVGAGSVVTKDVKENTVVAGNPAKVVRRIEPGPNVDRHHPEIQDQNDAMLNEMTERDRYGHDR